MAVYPFFPRPASVSAPELIDPMHRFETDQGYELRRSKHRRVRRRYRLEYLDLNTANMRLIRDFLQQQRLGVQPFEWIHVTAYDTVTYLNTTAVFCSLPHQYVTGQWVYVSNSIPHTALNGIWQLTRVSNVAFYLNGSTAGGAGSCQMNAYLPQAVARFADDTMESPATLIGPESVDYNFVRRGRFNLSVLIEELL